MSDQWMTRAACIGKDPTLWFPLTSLMLTAQEAISTCKECPVQSECFDYAVTNKVGHGIWGGVLMDAYRKNHRPPRFSEQEDELRDAVHLALDTGWSLNLISRNLKIPYQTVKRLAKERATEE